MYATDGYVDGASKDMAKMLLPYKVSVLVGSSKISRFFWTQYMQGHKIPPSIKRKILRYLKRHIENMSSVILAEESKS